LSFFEDGHGIEQISPQSNILMIKSLNQGCTAGKN
jgi:hypothetical protein